MSAARWKLAAVALAIAYCGVLAATAPAMGYTRDEGYYFKAAEQYAGWWDTLFSRRFTAAFGDEEIRSRFGYNTEHPALVKLAQGITFRVLHKWIGVVGPAQGFRFTGFLFAALSLFATFLLGLDTVSPRAGFLAALLMASQPRYFYDAHLACFDVPVTAMWTLSMWSFWRALEAPPERAGRRAIMAGLLFGLSLATKLNALFLPPLFVLIWLHRIDLRRSIAFVPGPSGGIDLRLPRIPWALIACAILGPLVFLAHWPYLWHDPIGRIGAYVGFHLNHEHYPIRYFGEVLIRPPFPWHFAWVMTALTVPAPIVVTGAIGLVHAIARILRRHTGDLVLVAGVLLPIALISLPGTPIFGGAKHWYNALPSLCVLAARGIIDGAEAVASRLPALRRGLAPAIAGLAALPGLLAIAASHPNGIAFYNEIAGGFTGGAELGMQRSFWGGVSRPLMPLLATEPAGTRVFFDHTNYDAYAMYLREGTLPSTLIFANTPQEADAATLFEDREGYPPINDAAWSKIGVKPSAGVYADEVTLVQLVTRRGQSVASPSQ